MQTIDDKVRELSAHLLDHSDPDLVDAIRDAVDSSTRPLRPSDVSRIPHVRERFSEQWRATNAANNILGALANLDYIAADGNGTRTRYSRR